MRTRIWEDLKEYVKIEELGKLAADHYTTHGRPFRIAVDVAGWIFKNLTDEEVAVIKNIS